MDTLRALVIVPVVAILATWGIASAQLPNRYARSRIGTVVVRNTTNVPIWVEMREGGSHLIPWTSFCLLPTESKSNDALSISSVHTAELRFQVSAHLRPGGCAAQQTLQVLSTPGIRTATFISTWKPGEKHIITHNEHDVIVEGRDPASYAIRVVTK